VRRGIIEAEEDSLEEEGLVDQEEWEEWVEGPRIRSVGLEMETSSELLRAGSMDNITRYEVYDITTVATRHHGYGTKVSRHQ